MASREEFSDDEFDDREDEFEGDAYGGTKEKSQKVTNQHFDETVELDDESDEEDRHIPTPEDGGLKRSNAGAPLTEEAYESKGAVAQAPPPAAVQPSAAVPAGAAAGGEEYDEEEESEEESEEEEEEESTEGESEEGEGEVKGYNPSDYAHLQVPSEVNELFQYIDRFKPQTIELDTKLKPFIPDYIPAVGEIDAFIKLPRPDGKPDNLGLTVLDEPAAKQSDATVIEMKVRSTTKQSNLQPMSVKRLENADKKPKEITNWIDSINELHRNKPPPTVNYSKPMPDIESLMQVWPPEIEDLLQQVSREVGTYVCLWWTWRVACLHR
uniref:Intraflagellar transport protein 46 homolog n=1 Tax=Palpitomonas bilix TaxID=652834 RepID=A0A7S3D4V8_9EUKA|mmetsp:Transcript_21707/g.56347  ORF Transcript_21707/g.56347 Transcript_21707/m.56347 type:complete len:325 (+) Transcript_21707:103-1077(+)